MGVVVQVTPEYLAAKFGATVNTRVKCVKNNMAYISSFMRMENRFR